MNLKHFFHHLFLPHHTNNQRAKLLHQESMLLLVAILFFGSLFLSSIKHAYPQVLGVSVDMSVDDLLLLTNIQRQENNLPVLHVNSELQQAAAAKAANMFAENYWAHNSPSGKTPWDFIHGAGYTYIYAGENLARGFTSAKDTVNAWMASPDHRANILSPNYTDVGFAIGQGNLTGETNTVLVVEEFGASSYAKPEIAPIAKTAVSETPSITNVPAISPAPVLGQDIFHSLTQIKQSPLINSVFWAKTLMIGLLALFLITFILDVIIVGKRQMVRIVGHNIDHILFFIAIVLIIYFIGQGTIF